MARHVLKGPGDMFNLRRVLVFWAAILSFLSVAGQAEAQTVTITIPTTGVKRDHQDGAGKIPLTQVNYRDCVDEDVITFTVTLSTGFANYALEAWVGDSCDTKTNRIGTTATCWRVFNGQPNNPVYSFDVPVRQYLSGRTNGANLGTAGTGGANSGGAAGTAGTAGTGGTAGTDVAGGGTGGTDSGGGGATSESTPVDGPKECNPTSQATAVQTLPIMIMLVDGGGNIFGQTLWKGTYKLLAPAPPSDVNSGVGENIAPISWKAQTGTIDSTFNGYQLYCDPAPGRAGAIEANALPEEGSTVLPSSCPKSTVLAAGKRPADKYKCGTAEKTSTRGSATGLLNYVPYNVAVASSDTYRNVGAISAPACAIPQPVTGFFEAYRAAGGEGGGGFCSFSLRRQPLPLMVLLGLGACLVQRRRRAA